MCQPLLRLLSRSFARPSLDGFCGWRVPAISLKAFRVRVSNCLLSTSSPVRQEFRTFRDPVFDATSWPWEQNFSVSTLRLLAPWAVALGSFAELAAHWNNGKLLAELLGRSSDWIMNTALKNRRSFCKSYFTVHCRISSDCVPKEAYCI